jgi:hypothetical protein
VRRGRGRERQIEERPMTTKNMPSSEGIFSFGTGFRLTIEA